MSAAPSQRYKLVFFTPVSSLSVCKEAIFAAGAGSYPGPGQYTEACFTTFGTGQFRPGVTAQPNIGVPEKLEEVAEAKVEVLCFGKDVVSKAVAGLKSVHPYEEVAYEVYSIEDF